MRPCSSSHYYLLSGVLLAYDLYRPLRSVSHIQGTIRDNDTFLLICAGVWAVSSPINYGLAPSLTLFKFAELSNLHTHLTLRSLRPSGTRKRAIPYGYGFSFLSCPNYFFEAIAWIALTVMTGSLAGTFYTTSRR